MDILQTLIGGLIGGGLIGFIEFMIRRSDEKKDKNSEIITRLDCIEKKIEKMSAKAAEQEAINCRIRILRFMDELLEGRRRSKDGYDQCLSDVTNYEAYCRANPGFKNGQTAATIEHIKHNYAERLEKNDFL